MSDTSKFKEDPLNPEQVSEYMDPNCAGDEKPTEKERIMRLAEMLDVVKQSRKKLLLDQESISCVVDPIKKKEYESLLVSQFKQNKATRIYCVTELRKLGVPIQDDVVPLSKI